VLIRVCGPPLGAGTMMLWPATVEVLACQFNVTACGCGGVPVPLRETTVRELLAELTKVTVPVPCRQVEARNTNGYLRVA